MSKIDALWLRISTALQSTLGVPVRVFGSPPLTNEAELVSFLIATPELDRVLREFGADPQLLQSSALHCDPSARGSIRSVLNIIQRTRQAQKGLFSPRASLNLFGAQLISGSPAIRATLESAGLDVRAFLFYIAHGVRETDAWRIPPADVSGKYQVEIANDDFTPMEFVVKMLTLYFGMSRVEAIQHMLRVHHSGCITLPQASLAEALELAASVNVAARQAYFPLLCRAVAQQSVEENKPDATGLLGHDVAANRTDAVTEQPRMDEHSFDPIAITIRSVSMNLRRNLIAGFHVAILRKITFDQICASWAQLIGLLVLSVLLPLGVQVIKVGSTGQLSSAGLPGALFVFPIFAIAAAVIAKLSKQEHRTLALVILLLSASLSIDTITTVLPALFKALSIFKHNANYQLVIYRLPGYWTAIAAAVALVRLLQIPGRQARVAGLVAGLLIATPLNYVWRDRELWAEPYDEETAKTRMSDYWAAADEDILYLQPALLHAQLAKLLPGRPGVPNLYFVGVAGYAEQDVFMKEINSIEKIFIDRFGTATHSIKLINNRNTLKTDPVASVTALKAVMQRLGDVMNPDQDILFLYMTSHGSKDHKFSIQFTPLQLADLEPQVLRKMLDDTHIKWRVIVVSACYSGGFIEPLKSDNTLIITAAAQDRTSFGCSDEEDYTYFGRAYFVDALTQTTSFIKAFDIAKAAVTLREKKDGFEPSNPQESIGRNIESELDSFEKSRGHEEL